MNVAVAGGIRVMVMTTMRHRVRVATVRMRRGAPRMSMHALCVGMHASRTVPCPTADHRCGSEALDGNRQGQKPHDHDPQNSRHPESLEHRAANHRIEALVAWECQDQPRTIRFKVFLAVETPRK